jgi:hypothetical protein
MDINITNTFYLSVSNKMFRFMSLLHMRNYSATAKSNPNPTPKTGCKMTHGGQSLVACNCVSKCQIMETRDEIDAFIANARCRVKCAHTNADPKPGDCSCTVNCIADMSELYCIMASNRP